MAFSATIAGHADPDTEQKAADALRAALAALGPDVIDTARGYFQHLGPVDLAPTPPNPADVARKALSDALALVASIVNEKDPGSAALSAQKAATLIGAAVDALDTLAPAPVVDVKPAPPVDIPPIQPGALEQLASADYAPAPVVEPDPAPASADPPVSVAL